MASTEPTTRGAIATAFGSLRVPYFAQVYFSGAIWSVARWGLGFLGAFVVNDMTGSPRLVQLTGSFMWGPLLFAGIIGGAVSDRFDRRLTVLSQFVVLIPLCVVLGALIIGDDLEWWMVLPFMLLVGVGWVIDMTARRALIYDLVGPDQINNAMALEMMASAIGLALGALVGGTVIELLGAGQAYFVIAGVLGMSGLLMWSVRPPDRKGPVISQGSFLGTVLEALRALPSNLGLVSILGVTVVVDFFHFAYFPIVQVIADRVDATPFLRGLLAAATGLGMIGSSLWVATAQPHRGKAYVYGSMGAMVLLLGFATFTTYWPVFVFLLLSSVCIGLFGATQSALAITATDDAMRGRAMGLLSMAIGSLPIGMYLLGELAERLGAPTALVIFNGLGLALLALWVWVRPEVLRTP